MFYWLEDTSAAIWVGESLWGYPIMLGLHIVGLAMVVGLFVMRDLRLLGFFSNISYQSTYDFTKLGWFGFFINAISGCFLFTSQASYFITHMPFLLKITMILMAALLAVFIQKRTQEFSADWDNGLLKIGKIKILAFFSIFLWAGAIIAGRLIAYL